MTLAVYHHPYSRAANTVWMLEELGAPYELRWVDLLAGATKAPEIVKLNAMGKVPVLVDGDVVVSESAAIGLYLADRYALGRLAPKLDAPARAAYLRWSLFAPSVIEPGTLAKASGWEVRERQAGWGNYDAMLETIESAIKGRDYLLGDDFSMADCIFGGTLQWSLRTKIIDARPSIVEYTQRLAARPAQQRANQKNAEVAAAHGLKTS